MRSAERGAKSHPRTVRCTEVDGLARPEISSRGFIVCFCTLHLPADAGQISSIGPLLPSNPAMHSRLDLENRRSRLW